MRGAGRISRLLSEGLITLPCSADPGTVSLYPNRREKCPNSGNDGDDGCPWGSRFKPLQLGLKRFWTTSGNEC